ncbi:MAG: DUF1361 domain-containing protein, partial [Anaerolineales bacterium]|nr:DUF1361 domain-containing protein [Anaerolineales bacterium]
LFRFRTILSGSDEYAFLLWNIFLAWIPLGMAYAAESFSWNRKTLIFAMPFAALLWLLFFPNAPYILTDLLHLRYPKEIVPLWFDVLLILWFSWTGLSLGIISLFMMQNIVRREFGRVTGWLFVLSVGFLTSLGIYIGRFLRWNSWDVLFNPHDRFIEFIYYSTNPSLQSIIFISVFSMLFIFIYVTIYTFGLLLQEQTQKT